MRRPLAFCPPAPPIYWLAQNLPGTTVLRNSVQPSGVAERDVFRDGALVMRIRRNEEFGLPKADHEIEFYENQLPADSDPSSCFVLRDPLNWLASRARHLLSHHGRARLEPNTWLRWSEAFCQTEAVAISYPDWVCSAEYREQLAERLGIEYTDRQPELVPDWGGGSSFDGTRYRRRASQMAVLHRWPYLLTLPHFYTIVRSMALYECLKVGALLFGHLEAIKQGLEAVKGLHRHGIEAESHRTNRRACWMHGLWALSAACRQAPPSP